ncbi:MAG TPA: NADH-quinone oxidoreductase subunit A [Anaerolineales bacterium]|nr:NADH-quinone oxidoreductase subunit A [Anaerolineales bacterium]
MLQDFLPIAVIIILAIALGFLVVFLGNTFGPRRPSLRKGMPYESGMKPYGEGTRRVPVKFYLVAVLFILFDIELVFFVPWAVVFRQFIQNGFGGFALIEMAVFIIILLVGYVYAWKKGAFEWE